MKTYYTKDGECKTGQYLPALDTCCNPIEGRYCCTATGDDSCMTIAECKKQFGPITKCGDWCCTDGKVCADSSASKCCPADTPNLCGSACCPGACNSAGTGCCAEGDTNCACKTGFRSCGSGADTWCCENANTCGKNKGQCCGLGICCENGAVPFCMNIDPTTGECDSSYPECCPAGSPMYSNGVTRNCCPSPGFSLFSLTNSEDLYCCDSDSYMSPTLGYRVYYDFDSGKEMEDYSCYWSGTAEEWGIK